MPSSTEKQRNYIFYLRGKYKSKENTPEDEKWIWESGWEKVKESHYTKNQIKDILMNRLKFKTFDLTPTYAKWIWEVPENELQLNENKTRKKYIKFFHESTKTLKNYRHGTTFKFAKNIKKYGFDLGERNAVYFAPANSPLAEVYGSDIVFIVDIIYNNPISFLEIQKNIIPILKQQNKKINESSINKELIKMGYDIILNKNEVAVLNLKNIKIKDIQEIK